MVHVPQLRPQVPQALRGLAILLQEVPRSQLPVAARPSRRSFARSRASLAASPRRVREHDGAVSGPAQGDAQTNL